MSDVSMNKTRIATKAELLPAQRLAREAWRRLEKLSKQFDRFALLAQIPSPQDIERIARELGVLTDDAEEIWYEISKLIWPKDAPRLQLDSQGDDIAANDLRPKASVTPIKPDSPPDSAA
jgi:hypothetical protein